MHISTYMYCSMDMHIFSKFAGNAHILTTTYCSAFWKYVHLKGRTEIQSNPIQSLEDFDMTNPANINTIGIFFVASAQRNKKNFRPPKNKPPPKKEGHTSIGTDSRTHNRHSNRYKQATVILRSAQTQPTHTHTKHTIPYLPWSPSAILSAPSWDPWVQWYRGICSVCYFFFGRPWKSFHHLDYCLDCCGYLDCYSTRHPFSKTQQTKAVGICIFIWHWNLHFVLGIWHFALEICSILHSHFALEFPFALAFCFDISICILYFAFCILHFASSILHFAAFFILLWH